jgi:hypothetical protein
MLHLGKRIHPAPAAPTNLTHDPAGSAFQARRRETVQRRSGLHGLTSRRHREVHIGRSRKGRFIRHAGFQTAPVLSLAVAVIGASVGVLLVTTIGLAALEAQGFLAAMGTAITLAAVTMAAEIKNRAAGRKVTHALAKDRGTCNRHRFREGALDNRRRS